MAGSTRDTIYYYVYLDGEHVCGKTKMGHEYTSMMICGHNKTLAWDNMAQSQWEIIRPGEDMPARRRFKLIQEGRELGTG